MAARTTPGRQLRASVSASTADQDTSSEPQARVGGAGGRFLCFLARPLGLLAMPRRPANVGASRGHHPRSLPGGCQVDNARSGQRRLRVSRRFRRRPVRTGVSATLAFDHPLYRTQEVAGSSPPSSILQRPCKWAGWISRRGFAACERPARVPFPGTAWVFCVPRSRVPAAQVEWELVLDPAPRGRPLQSRRAGRSNGVPACVPG
jgi:hypothetical protein